MGYLHENEISEYLGLFGHIIRSFNKYWLLGLFVLPLFWVFRVFTKRHPMGSYRVPTWCTRWLRYARFDPYSEYCLSMPNDDYHVRLSHNMMRRRCPPGYSYEIRRLPDSDKMVFHRYPDWPEGVYTNPDRGVASVGGDVVWSGVVPPHRTPWKDIEWTQES